MKRKRLWLNVALMITLTVMTVWYLSKTQIITPQTLSSLRFSSCITVVFWVYLNFAFLSFIEKFIYGSFCKYPYATAMLTTLYGNLGSSVSPLKSAHFPLKTYAQKTRGMLLSQTLTGVTKCQIIFSLTSIFVYGTLMIILIVFGQSLYIGEWIVPAYTVVAVGFSANVIICIVLTLVSRFEKLRTLVLTILASIIKIFRKRFDKELFIRQKTDRLQLFKQQTSAVFSDFRLFLFPSIAYAVYMVTSCLAPYVSYLSVTGVAFSLKDCFNFYLLALAVVYLTNVIPVPGGCVVAEFSFSIIFKAVLGKHLAQTLLLWRFCTYYIPTVINLVVFAITSLKRGAQNG